MGALWGSSSVDVGVCACWRLPVSVRAGRMEVIEAVRRTLNSMNLKQSETGMIEVTEAIGEGTVSWGGACGV